MGLSEAQRLLAVPIFGLVRFIFLIIDGLAAMAYGNCARGCGQQAFPGCEGLLGFVAVLNFFSVGALVLLVLIRWFSEERAYAEALFVTRALVVLDVVLKLGDAGSPVLINSMCFPDSIPPFNSTMSMPNCEWQGCPVGNLYAVYSLYVLLKSGLGLTDVVLNTPTLVRKPREWYRLRGTYAR